MIPRVVHRLWLGGKEPSTTAPFSLTWERPGWEVINWTEDSILALFPLENQALYDAAEIIAPQHVGQFRSDILRYEILYKYGGVYVDTDFECLKPLDPLLGNVECFAAKETATVINNAILGAVPGHPFIKQLIEKLPDSVESSASHRPAMMSGPRHITRVYNSMLHPGVELFARDLFYPYGVNEVDQYQPGDTFENSFAVHHWRNRRRERGNVRLSIAIMAHPLRQEFVEELAPKLPGARVIYDVKGDRWDTGRRSLLAFDPDATHHLVVQDDAILCEDFLPAVESAAAAADQHPIALYMGTGRPHRPAVIPAAQRAREARSPWIAGRGPSWGVAVVIPVGHIEQMVEWCDERTNVANYDLRMEYYFVSRGIDCWYTFPSLVNHRPVNENPSLVPGRTSNRQALKFVEGSPLGIDWWRRPVQLYSGLSSKAKENSVARKALRDTYGIDGSSGVDIRRKVKAGAMVPSHWEMPEGTVEEVADSNAMTTVFGSSPRQVPPGAVGVLPRFDGLTIPKLKAECDRLGIKYPGSSSKSQLLALLEQGVTAQA